MKLVQTLTTIALVAATLLAGLGAQLVLQRIGGVLAQHRHLGRQGGHGLQQLFALARRHTCHRLVQ